MFDMRECLRWPVGAVAVVLGLAAGACGGTVTPEADGSESPTVSTPMSGAVISETPEPTAAPTPEPTAAPTAAPKTPDPGDEPAPDGLRALVAGHNDIDADRINIIMAPWGWDDLAEFETVAAMFVGWDQRAQLFDVDGLPTNDRANAAGADLGLFGFEPFRSNASKFNVWIGDTGPTGPAGWLNGIEPSPFDLRDQTLVVLARDPGREVPGIYSVAGQDLAFGGVEAVVRDGTDSVADAMVSVSGDYPAGTIRELPHELGHALFGFADEYLGRTAIEDEDIPTRQSYWPTCAADRATAEAWWGALIGQTDPMVAIWAAELEAAGFPVRDGDLEYWQGQVETAYVASGCHGDPLSFRSAEDTLMGFNAPGFGLTNTRHAMAVLALWEG